MTRQLLSQLSRRERQIMEVLLRLERASAIDIRGHLDADLSDSAIRTFLRSLVEKGFVEHVQEGKRYIYTPLLAPDHAKRSAIQELVSRVFGGSISDAVAALVDPESGKLDAKELAEIEALIERAKER